MYPTHVLVLLFLELRKLASVLVDGWMATIRSQSVSSSGSPAGTVQDRSHFTSSKSLSLYSPQQFVTRPLFIFSEKKKKKDESKVPVREVKEKSGDEEKKKEKPKAHAPSHAKIRSIGNLTNSKCYSFGSFKFCMKCSTCFLPRRTGDGHSKPGPP